MGYEVPSRVQVHLIIPKREVAAQGIIEADGTEQVVVDVAGMLSLEGYIDLSEMEDGDAVVLKRYVRVSPDSGYALHAEETFVGRQLQPAVRFPPVAGYYGIRVTLRQTSGTFKRFPYIFFKEV